MCVPAGPAKCKGQVVIQALTRDGGSEINNIYHGARRLGKSIEITRGIRGYSRAIGHYVLLPRSRKVGKHETAVTLPR